MTSDVSRIDGKLVYHGEIMPPGPWHDEPDHVDFEAHGFPCILHRNSSWCGYVGVPPSHPWHGRGYDDVRVIGDEWPDVHGGLTYADACSPPICHEAKPGEPTELWWLGFDCSHIGDLALYSLLHPLLSRFGTRGDTYRDLAYAQAETEKLAAQAAQAMTNGERL